VTNKFLLEYIQTLFSVPSIFFRNLISKFSLYLDHHYINVFYNTPAKVDVTIEPDVVLKTDLNNIELLMHFAEEALTNTNDTSNKELLMHFTESSLVDTMKPRNLDVLEYVNTPTAPPVIRLNSFAESCRQIFFLLC